MTKAEKLAKAREEMRRYLLLDYARDLFRGLQMSKDPAARNAAKRWLTMLGGEPL